MCTRRSGLVVRPTKCSLLWPSSQNVPESLSSLAADRKIKVCKGSMEVFGAPVGCDAGFSKLLSGYVKSQSRFFELLLRPDLSVQVAFLLLRLSGIPRFGFLSRVIRPSVLLNSLIKWCSVRQPQSSITAPLSDSVHYSLH